MHLCLIYCTHPLTFFPLSVWNCGVPKYYTLAIVHNCTAKEREEMKIDDKNQCRCLCICLSYVGFFLSFNTELLQLSSSLNWTLPSRSSPQLFVKRKEQKTER